MFNYALHNCNSGNVMEHVQLGRSGQFFLSNFATALTGIVILIIGVYGFLLLLLTPFTIIGAVLYMLAGCVLIFLTFEKQLKDLMPSNLRWLIFDATPIELILHSKTAWKAYGLILATFTMGKIELQDYLLKSESSLMTEFTIYPGDSELNQKYCANESGMIMCGESSTLLNSPVANDSIDNTRIMYEKARMKTESTPTGKLIAYQIMDLAMESVQRKLESFLKKKLLTIYKFLFHELALTINGAVKVHSKIILKYLQFNMGHYFIPRCISFKAIEYLTISSKNILQTREMRTAIGNSKYSERILPEGETGNFVANSVNKSSKCGIMLISPFGKIEQELDKSMLPSFKALQNALAEYSSCLQQSKPNCDHHVALVTYISLQFTNIVALQMATIPSTYAWLRTIYAQKLLIGLSCGNGDQFVPR